MWNSWRRLTRCLGLINDRTARRRQTRQTTLFLEGLESRDVPAPLTWAAGVALPTAGGIVAQPEGTNLLVAAGPSTTSYNLTAADPTWKASATATVQPLDFARSSPGIGALPNGYFLVFGGTQNGFATSAVTQYDPNTVTVVDGATNQTRSLRSMNVPRAEFGWLTDANDLSYAIGGLDNNGTPLASVEVYNPTANTWTYLAPLPQTLYGESAVSDGAGHLYVFGGVGANGSTSNLVYRYTIAANTWDLSASPLQVAVRDSAAVLASNGMIYVLGGKTSSGTTAMVESYSLTSNTWTMQPSLPQAVSSEAAASDSLGRIEVLGGYDANGNALSSLFISQKLNQADLAPAITSIPSKADVVNSAYSYQVLSTANPQAAYALTTAPAGMTINASTGLISWTPGYTTEGVESVTVVASNSVGQATQSFSITVSPRAPTGVAGNAISTTQVSLSWNASSDPNVTSYDVYKQDFVHGGKGSGGSYYYALVASGITTNSATLSGGGAYAVTAVDSAGLQSARSALVGVAAWSPPDLYVATTLSGADIGSLTLNVGQTGQIRLIQEFANPSPTFSVVTQPPSGGVSVDPASGLVTFTPTAADIGAQSIKFAASNIAGTSDFTFPFYVQANQPTVTVSGGPFTYDGNSHAVVGSAVGADGVTPVNGSFTYTYNGSATPPTAAGSYPVVATFTSADPDYANGSASYTLIINQAAPTITVSSGPFAYDGNQHGATATAVGVDGVTPVDGSFSFTYNGDATVPTGPGLYTVAATFTSNDPNYTSPTVNANLIINSPGALVPTLTLVDGSATFDGNPHSDTASAVGADGVTPVSGSFLITYNGSPTAPTQAGSYAVAATFISSDLNYTNASITGTLMIGQATPTLSFGSNTDYYNGRSALAVVTALGVDGVTPVNGSYTITYNNSPTLPVNAGTYEVEITFTSNDPNYTSTSGIGTLTILPATPSVGLGNGGQWEFTYNGSLQSVVGSAYGYGANPVNGTFFFQFYDSNNNPLSGPPTNAGYYPFTEYFSSADPNYAGGSFSWQEIIFSAEPTISVSGGPFTYNGSSQGATASVVGIDGVTPVSGTTTFTYNGSDNAPSLPGVYAVVASFASSDPNYYSSSGSGTIVINKATPAFSGLSSPTVNVGTSTVTLSGRIGIGSAGAGGDDVAITLNGVTEPVTVSNGGSFSATFSIAGLTTGTYPISYTFLGDATRFNAAAAGSGTLTVQAAPSILTNPSSQTVVSGNSVTFSASASGYPTPTVQWQQSTNGSTFTNISGATGASYTISAVTASQNGYRYRAVFTNQAGSATTTAATLTVQYAPAVTRNPSSATVNAGQSVTFTAAATGNPMPTVQWQVSTNGGQTWSNISGATSTTLTLTNTTAAQNGNLYRAVFTNSVGAVTTTAATLTVRFAPIIITNPNSQTVNAGQSATFTAAANGNPSVTVQWQVSTDGGNTFTNISGAAGTTLTIGTTTKSLSGYHYRAVFKNSLGSATTADAILTVI